MSQRLALWPYDMDYGRMALESRVKADTAADRVAIEIRKRLGELGQSQAALARVLEESPMWVSQRLNGTVQMGVNDLYRVAEAVGLTMSELVARAERSGVGGATGHTLTLASVPSAPSVTGRTPWPDHPIVAGATRIPLQRSAVDAGPPGRGRKTYPIGQRE